MSIPRWNPSQALSRQEQLLMKRLDRVRKLFGFLRRHRHELFDDAFQAELESMYRDTDAGKEPNPPAMMAMALLLQGYVRVSDAEAVELTIVDLRWQMVLGCLGTEETAFSQGSLVAFRNRLIKHDMDRRLLERTVELARRTKEFDWKKLPKSLRLAVDSSPLEGAGRVEDTFNLLGHAARKIVQCAAKIVNRPQDEICREAGIPILLASSVKQALDIYWDDDDQKHAALQTLVAQLDSLERWLARSLSDESKQPPLADALATLAQLRGQDLEPDPTTGGTRIRDGVAADRRVSVEEPEMRHGRKSKSKLFNGYKRHIGSDVDSDLILACAITPANRPEAEATPSLRADLERQNVSIGELLIDRAFVGSDLAQKVIADGGKVICRPWVSRNGDLFPKEAFKLNLHDMTITCIAGQTVPIRLGKVAEFPAEGCDRCEFRSKCTSAAPGRGRTVSISSDERLQQRLRREAATPRGRRRLRTRVGVEHRLAHIARRQGNRARYRGTRKNLFDLRRVSAIQNLETNQRRIAQAEVASPVRMAA